MNACLGKYCECRYHLTPDIPAWVIEDYTPSAMAQSVLHAMWEDGRTEPTDEEQSIAWGELVNLAEAARTSLGEPLPRLVPSWRFVVPEQEPVLRDAWDLDDDERRD